MSLKTTILAATILLVCPLGAPPARAQASNLVAAYAFNENAGPTVNDTSGNGNNGTISAATWTTSGKFGNALLFNGTSARISVPDASSLDLTAAATIEAWVYPTGTQTGWRTVVQKQTDSYFLHASNSAGGLRPAAGGTFGSIDTYVSAPSAIPVNAWSHLAMTYDGSTIRLYVNGTQMASTQQPGAITPTGSPLWIGGNQPYGEYFKGRIDEVRIYKVALTSAQIATDMATPVGPADGVPPSIPGPLTATAINSARVDLAWGAATDDTGVTGYDVERCAGPSCSSFSQIGSAAGTTYSDTTAAPQTSYSYRVRAGDAAGNRGPYSNVALASTPAAPDNPPGAPSALGGSAPGPSQVNLTWTAATDDHGISLYEVERCTGVGCTSFGLIGTSTTTSYPDATTLASTTYLYRVRAKDTIGQYGGYSNTFTIATPAAPDTTPPGAPGTFTATASGSARIDLVWTAATDDRGVVRYDIERCVGAGCTGFGSLASTTGLTYSDTGLTPSTTYVYRVRAFDAAQNAGAWSANASATTTAAPSATGLVGAWAFDEGTGTTSADASGNGNTATLQGATWVTTGKYGNALSFNGTTAKAVVADASSLDLTSAMTIEGWFYPAVAPSGWRTGVYKETDKYYLEPSTSQGAPCGGGTFGTSNQNAYGSSALATGVWTHLATTYDGTFVRLYVNGVLSGTASAAGSISSSASPLTFGGNSPYGEYWNGRIDDVRIYARALSVSEIQTDMATPVGAPPPPNGPKLIITAPGEGSTVPGSTIGITYTTTGDLSEVNHVHFQLDQNPVVMDLTFDGVYSMPGVHVGAHTLNGWLVRADHSAIAGSDAVPVHFANVVDPADTVPPTVQVTAPAAGSTVSGVVTVTASASDNLGVYGVQFKLDGALLGAEDLASPWSASWDTASSTNGSHVLTAVARDVAGNETTSASVSVTVSNLNPNDPSLVGSWAGPFTWPLVSVHESLMPTGKVLLYDDHTVDPGVQVWDPVTMSLTPRPYNPSNLFCSGPSLLPDGRVIILGGHIANYVGLQDTTFFDPVALAWSAGPPMQYGRWYPTATALPNGKILSTSGAINCPTCTSPTGSHSGIALLPEVYDPQSNTWTTLTAASLSLPLYPHMIVLPDGRVFASSSQEDPIVSKVLDIGAQTWTTVDASLRDGGSSVMYRPWKILKTGSARNPDYPAAASVPTSWVIDMSQPSPTWRSIASMGFARTQHNLTMLPDGNVFVVGGGTTSDVYATASAVKTPEMWNPDTETYKTLAPMQEPRLYHSASLLLPDGRVAVSGGGRFGPDFPTVELYSPPYLFKGARPAITSAPQTLTLGAHFAVGTPDGARIAKVTLLRLGSPTHAFDMNQRYLELAFTTTAGGLDVVAPASANLAIPGHYMLFLVDNQGIPSQSAIVRFPAPWEDPVAPGAPSTLVATGTVGAADLTWGAASDNVGVTRYNVHRSATSGFTASAANFVGSSTTTSYHDGGIAAGTWYWLVTAQDQAGNVGPPSNQAQAVVAADTVGPTVAVTAPSSGATVSGVVSVTASASDNVGVVGVQFLLDGASLLAEDTTSPYGISWNSATASNGAHTLSARARDAAGNQTLAANVPVTVSNTAAPGPVAAYGFNTGSGPTAFDATANANDGTITGATWAAGHAGSGLTFDGSGDYVTVPNSATIDVLGTGLTIEAWVNLTTSNAIDYVLVAKPWSSSGNPSPYYQYGIEYDANGARTLDFLFGDTAGQLHGPYSMIPLTATWTHMAFTYDGTSVKGYLDGALKFTTAASGSLSARGTALRIGVDGLLQQGLKGTLDDLRIYNRALSAAEIGQDMATAVTP